MVQLHPTVSTSGVVQLHPTVSTSGVVQLHPTVSTSGVVQLHPTIFLGKNASGWSTVVTSFVNRTCKQVDITYVNTARFQIRIYNRKALKSDKD